jgi:septum formation inhibitor MinC
MSEIISRNIPSKMAKRKSTKDKQRSTKHTHKTKDRVTRIPLKSGVNTGAPKGSVVLAPLVAPVSLMYKWDCSLIND